MIGFSDITSLEIFLCQKLGCRMPSLCLQVRQPLSAKLRALCASALSFSSVSHLQIPPLARLVLVLDIASTREYIRPNVPLIA